MVDPELVILKIALITEELNEPTPRECMRPFNLP
jgi:hypothetical protein